MSTGLVYVTNADLKKYQVNRVDIAATASGDNTLVSAVAGKKIRVLSLDFLTNSPVSIAWKSGSNILREARDFGQYGGLAIDYGRYYFTETNAGEALIMNLSAAVEVRGQLFYVEI